MTFRNSLSLAALSVAILAGLSGPVLAQANVSRPGLPAVNTPLPAADPEAANRGTLAAFSAWNARQGRPSLLLFWNRQLIEDGTSQYDAVTSTTLEGSADRSSGVSVGWASAGASSSTSASVSAVTRSYSERTTSGKYGFGDGLFSKGVESSLMGTLLGAGARVMDREALIRSVGAAKSKDERMDIQHLETLALQKGVKYLIEVLPNDNAGSPTGVSFTVKVTHLPTSTIKAQFVTTGEPPKGPAKFVAANGGFERRADESHNTPERIGKQVALEAMSRLH